MDLPQPPSLTNVALLFGTSLVIYVLVTLIYNLYFHPLAHYPGPRICAATELYGMYYDMFKNRFGGYWSNKVHNLHQTYGPIVRISPNEVHIMDSDFYHKIYNFDPELEKKPSHIPNLQFSETTAEHRKRRRPFDPFFSRGSIQKLEPLIKSTIEKMCAQIEHSPGIVDLSFWYRCMTFEIISDWMLAQPYNLMDDPDKSLKMIKSFHSVFQIIKPIQNIAWIGFIMNNLEKLPSWMQFAPGDEGAAYVKIWDEGLRPRLERVREGKVESGDGRSVLMQEYLKNDGVEDVEKGYDRIKQAMLLFVGAGMETTGYALSMATYQLLRQPEILQQLKREIENVWPKEQEEIPTWSALERLPLLTAVLRESMRLSLGVAARLTRVNHKKAIQYNNWTIPPGCYVSMNQSFVLYDPEIFIEPKRFDPGRWMQEEKSKELEKYFVPFSRGLRGCIGERLAWAEMYLTLATVVHRFEMELYQTEDVDVYPVLDHFVPFPERENGVRVTIKK